MSVEVNRLRNARAIAEECGGQSAFGRRLSMERQQVNHIIGRNPCKIIGSAIARRIESTFGRPTGWLDEEHVPAGGDIAQAPFVDIPALDVQQAAGKATVMPVDHIMQYVRVPKDWLRVNAIAAAESMRLMTYSSDDMEPTISANSVLLVDRAASAISRSGVYVLNEGSNIFVRRCSQVPGNGSILACDNTAYPSVTLPALEPAGVLVLGRVMVSWPTRIH